MRELPVRSVVATASRPKLRAPLQRRLMRAILPCMRTSLVSGTLFLVAVTAIFGALTAGTLAILRVVDPPGSALILSQRLDGVTIDQRWVPLGSISPNLMRAVIASEDNQFCRHSGVDLRELEAVLEQADMDSIDQSRGGSTITMQVAKNLFLWNDRSVIRKAIEIPLAFAIEAMWPKDRIMEIYLNIAEWGPGIFGAEAAAQHHFRKPASRLTEREAALLAVGLPNPRVRVPSRPSAHVLKVASIVERRARVLGTRADCVAGR